MTAFATRTGTGRREYELVSRVCGYGADGATVIVRDVPDSGSESDAREVDRVIEWVDALADVERVCVESRAIYRSE